MKKLLVAFLGMSLMFSACMSKEEKQAKWNEELAASRVKVTLKCPSTMQLDRVDQLLVEEKTDIDTLYHIQTLKRRVEWFYGSKFEHEVTEIIMDSIKYEKRTYPEHVFCQVWYDAQNSYGAMVRGSESIVIENGVAYLHSEFISKYFEVPEVSIFSIEPIKYTDGFREGLEYSIKKGDWVKLSNLFNK